MPTTVTIHWCSLIPEQTDHVRASLQELSQKLSTRYPDLPHLTLRELPPDMQRHLPAFLDGARDKLEDPEHQDTPLDGKKVFVFCPRNDAHARRARDENPQAQWGAAAPGDYGHYALAWTPEKKYLIWHEAMHLLYAED